MELQKALHTKEHMEGFLIACALFCPDFANVQGERTISPELSCAEVIERLQYQEDHPFMESLTKLEKHYTK